MIAMYSAPTVERGSFIMDRRGIDQSVSGALPLSYGASAIRGLRRRDSNPQPPAPEACTPDRQSVLFSNGRLHKRPSNEGKVRTASSLVGCSLNRQLDSQRRRWESNPGSNCFAGSCRPGRAASRNKQRPHQESNLVFDLRKVACESGTLRGQNNI